MTASTAPRAVDDVRRGRHQDVTVNRYDSDSWPAGHITTTEACRRTGLSYRQMNHLIGRYHTELGIGEPHPGHGAPRWVPLELMPHLHVIADLRDVGMELPAIMRHDLQRLLRVRGALYRALGMRRHERTVES